MTFLLDATIPFQWGYEEIKNPGEKGNIGEVEAKTLYLVGGGEGLLTYTYIRTEIKYIIQRYILSDNDMIYTHANMYIAFVTPVIDVRDRDLV